MARIASSSSVRIKAEYEVFREDDLLAIGETTHAFVSGEGKVVRPPRLSWNGSGKARRNPDNSSADRLVFVGGLFLLVGLVGPGDQFAHGFCGAHFR